MSLLSASNLLAAALTGVFCAALALVLDQLLSMLNWWAISGVSFTSGFLESLFAKAVVGAET